MQLSPDGTRIAFASQVSGHSEVWVTNRNGSNAKQLTSFAGDGRVGSPSWSADGQRISFDAQPTATGQWNIHIVAADGGPVKPLTSDACNNVRPSWSIDDRWIYFGSDRTGDWQIWKVPSGGGEAQRITSGGGVEPVVSSLITNPWSLSRILNPRSLNPASVSRIGDSGSEIQGFGTGISDSRSGIRDKRFPIPAAAP